MATIGAKVYSFQLQRKTRGRSFKELRLRLGLTHGDVAGKLRVESFEVMNYEDGEPVREDVAERIACYHLSLIKQGEIRRGIA